MEMLEIRNYKEPMALDGPDIPVDVEKTNSKDVPTQNTKNYPKLWIGSLGYQKTIDEEALKVINRLLDLDTDENKRQDLDYINAVKDEILGLEYLKFGEYIKAVKHLDEEVQSKLDIFQKNAAKLQNPKPDVEELKSIDVKNKLHNPKPDVEELKLIDDKNKLQNPKPDVEELKLIDDKNKLKNPEELKLIYVKNKLSKIKNEFLVRKNAYEKKQKDLGYDTIILNKISEQNLSHASKDEMLLFLKPKSYQKNRVQKKENHVLVVLFSLLWVMALIVESTSLSVLPLSEVYVKISIVLFLDNMLSTAFTIYSLYKAEIRLNSFLSVKVGDDELKFQYITFSIGLSEIITVAILFPWSTITGVKNSQYLTTVSPSIIARASIGMILLYTFVGYILINSIIKMSKVLSRAIHDGRERVVQHEYIDLEPKEEKDLDLDNVYNVIYTKDEESIKAEFLSQYKKIKSFKKFISGSLIYSLPELIISVALTSYLVFVERKLSTLTLLYINCSVYPFSLLMISAIIFNKKIRSFEDENNMDTDLIIEFLGVEITQSWLLTLASPVYTFLIKLYGINR